MYHISNTECAENQPSSSLANVEMYHSSFPPPDCQINSSESEYMRRRNEKELSHKDWVKQRNDLEKEIQEKLGENMKVQSNDNRVKFIYKYKGYEVEVLDVTIFRFKIILVYYSLLRKWYISPGYSFVPEVIDLKGKLKSGTNDPFSEEVLNIIHGVKCTIDAFMKRLTDVYQFVHDAQRRYKDVQFAMNAVVTKMKLTFTENAWPNDLQKSSAGDRIVVELKLNKNIEVCNVRYQYIPQKRQLRTETAKNLNKLESELQNFFYFPLEEAFERFIIREEGSTSSQEEESEHSFLRLD